MSKRCAWSRCEVRLQLGCVCNGSHTQIAADIERELGVEPPPLLREYPSATLYAAAKLLIQTHARRLPMLDNDTETGHEVIVSVLTQYRLLKFISINVSPWSLSLSLILLLNHIFSARERYHNCI